MGEIADAMLDGTLCEGCGVYLGEATGYSIKCQDCRPQRKFKHKKKAFASYARGYAGRESAWEGITNYLAITYEIDCFKKGNQKRTKNLIRKFLKAKNLVYKEGNTYRAMWFNANVIQANFQSFVAWLNKQDLSHF